MSNFLKKYSLIDSKFIDEYYSFYTDNDNQTDYIIDLNKLAYWLNVNKSDLKKLLIENFEENEDYIIETNKLKQKNITTIMLKNDCSKMLSMISSSPKAKTICKFHIELEKTIIKYTQTIINSINNQHKIDVI